MIDDLQISHSGEQRIAESTFNMDGQVEVRDGASKSMTSKMKKQCFCRLYMGRNAKFTTCMTVAQCAVLHQLVGVIWSGVWPLSSFLGTEMLGNRVACTYSSL